jgi:hypothetical protein
MRWQSNNPVYMLYSYFPFVEHGISSLILQAEYRYTKLIKEVGYQNEVIILFEQ